MKFRIKNPGPARGARQSPAGKHAVGGRMYRDGDIIESDTDLRETFPNKFELVGDNEKVSEGTSERVPPMPSRPQKEVEAPSSGRSDPLAPPPGSDVPTNEPGSAETRAAVAAGDKPAKAPSGADNTAEGAEKGPTDAGAATGPEDGAEDVSDTYPAAADNDLMVWKVGKKFHVTTAADPSKKISDAALTAKGVENFLATYGDEEDGEDE